VREENIVGMRAPQLNLGQDMQFQVIPFNLTLAHISLYILQGNGNCQFSL
jgi:hypothetical protein